MKEFTPHKLNEAFNSESGIVLPEGTVVYLRKCKPNADVRLEFFIDNSEYSYTEELEEDPAPAYYLYEGLFEGD